MGNYRSSQLRFLHLISPMKLPGRQERRHRSRDLVFEFDVIIVKLEEGGKIGRIKRNGRCCEKGETRDAIKEGGRSYVRMLISCIDV